MVVAGHANGSRLHRKRTPVQVEGVGTVDRRSGNRHVSAIRTVAQEPVAVFRACRERPLLEAHVGVAVRGLRIVTAAGAGSVRRADVDALLVACCIVFGIATGKAACGVVRAQYYGFVGGAAVVEICSPGVRFCGAECNDILVVLEAVGELVFPEVRAVICRLFRRGRPVAGRLPSRARAARPVAVRRVHGRRRA